MREGKAQSWYGTRCLQPDDFLNIILLTDSDHTISDGEPIAFRMLRDRSSIILMAVLDSSPYSNDSNEQSKCRHESCQEDVGADMYVCF